jgi:Predicted membrane protein
MTLQQWLFSIKGRIGRRDFWIWMGIWVLAMIVLFTLAGSGWLNLQTAAFALVCLLWPTAAVTVKRLHDRGKSGIWALLMVLAWMLLAGNWAMLPGVWQWGVGRFVPTLIIVMMLIDLGAFVGTQGENKYGEETLDVKYR